MKARSGAGWRTEARTAPTGSPRSQRYRNAVVGRREDGAFDPVGYVSPTGIFILNGIRADGPTGGPTRDGTAARFCTTTRGSRGRKTA